MTSKTELNTNNFKNLDFIRSIAVLLVLFSHLPGIKYPDYFHVQTLGILGVFIFFVHTSYVLMISLERMNYTKNNILNYKFYTQRLFRIYPLSIFVVSLTAFTTIYNSPETYFDLYIFFKNIFLVQGLNESSPEVLWSLPYEVAMYLFLPFIFNFIKDKNSKKKIILLWLFFVILVLSQKYFNTRYFSTIKYVPFFLSGVIGYVYYKGVKKIEKINPIYLVIYIFFSIFLIPILVKIGFKQNFLGAIFCVPLGLLIAFCKDMNSFVLNKLFKLIAKYSYGIYLFQIILISNFEKYIHIENKTVSLFLLIIIIFLVSAAAYHVIESPFIKFGKKISAKY